MEALSARVVRRLFVIGNWVLLALQFVAGVAVASAFMMRETYASLTESIYGESAPLLGSVLADAILRPQSAFIVLLLFGLSIWKEFKVTSLGKRAAINGGLMALFMIMMGLLIPLIYGPVFSSPVL